MKTVLGDNLYTLADIAKMLGTTVPTVASYVKTGKLKAVIIGRRKYINETSLKNFINPE